MWAYIIRRILWSIPIVLGIVLITQFLFGVVAKDPARAYAGKFATTQAIQATRARMGLNKPVWINKPYAHGRFSDAFDTQVFDVLLFRFPNSMRYEESFWSIVSRKAPVSLLVQVPAFLIIVGLELVFALYSAANRGRFSDLTITLFSIFTMSVPALSVYIFSQWFFGQKMGLFPVAGWDQGIYAVNFAALPIFITVILGLGVGTRFYRTVVLEEILADYVRTARAKGVSEREILFTHVMRNALIPVITRSVASLPELVLGACSWSESSRSPAWEDCSSTPSPTTIGRSSWARRISWRSRIALLLVSDILYTWANPQVRLG